MTTEFSKELLKSAANDVALPNAKARALAHVEHAMKLAPVAASAAAATTMTTAKFGFAMLVAASLGGAIGAGSGYAIGHSSQPGAASKMETASELPNVSANGNPISPLPISTSSAAASNGQPLAASSAQPVATADVCSTLTAEPSDKCSVSGGRTVTFAIKNDCSQAPLDVFWVDSSCREIYRGVLAPSAMFWQDSWEGHVFRLRDRVTHKLVKEFSPTAIDTAPDRAKLWKGPPTEIPVVAIGDENKPLAEAAPSECAHGGGRAAVYHFQNDRKNEPILLSRVDGDCKESGASQIDPGKKFEVRASEGHAFRLRDASGALLMDVPPTSLDTSTYLSVP